MTLVRRPRDVDKARKAAWYLSRGFPATWIAVKLGTHVNTISNWKRSTKVGARQRVARTMNRVRSLSKIEQHELFAMLVRELDAKLDQAK